MTLTKFFDLTWSEVPVEAAAYAVKLEYDDDTGVLLRSETFFAKRAEPTTENPSRQS